MAGVTDRPEGLPDIPLRSVANADGRRRPVQDYRRMRRQLLADLGGADVPATKLAVIEMLAQASAIARAEFAALVADPTRDPGRFSGIGNLVLGASRTLGLKRQAKDVSLADYLAATSAEDARAGARPEDTP